VGGRLPEYSGPFVFRDRNRENIGIAFARRWVFQGTFAEFCAGFAAGGDQGSRSVEKGYRQLPFDQEVNDTVRICQCVVAACPKSHDWLSTGHDGSDLGDDGKTVLGGEIF